MSLSFMSHSSARQRRRGVSGVSVPPAAFSWLGVSSDMTSLSSMSEAEAGSPDSGDAFSTLTSAGVLRLLRALSLMSVPMAVAETFI